jgi:hypothetical protein
MGSFKKVAAVAVLACLVLPLASEGMAGKKRRERTTVLAEGVTYTVIRDRSGPFRIRYVSVDLEATSTIDTILANEKLPKFETTSSMAQRSGALVAINGDYARSSGRPVFTFAADGHLAQTPLAWGRNFATTYDESGTYIGHPEVTAVATEAPNGMTYPISKVNYSDEPLSGNEVRLFTRQAGNVATAPAGHCLVRLQPLEGPYVAEVQPGVEQAFTVELGKCGGRSLRPKGGAILATPMSSQYASSFAAMFPGEEVGIAWSLTWPNVLDTIGGNPTLIEAGQVIANNTQGSGSFFARHPRTGIGTTADGRVLFVTVDGRQPKYSVGMTLQEFADLFVSLGAEWALNLDGGGSTTIAINGEVVNRPSDKNSFGERVERGVSSAVLLLPGADPGEMPQPDPSPSTILPLTGSGPATNISLDPASTGGMLDAMARRGYALSPALERILRTYRTTRSTR